MSDQYHSFNEKDPIFNHILEFIEEHLAEINSVLDIGCSNGFLLKQIKKRFPKIKLYGLDMDKKLIESINDNKISAKVGSIEKNPYSTNSIDFVIAKDVIEHARDNEAAFKEMKRVSKKYIFISAPGPYTECAWGDFTHIRPYTKTTLRHIESLFNVEIVKIGSTKRMFPFRLVAMLWMQPLDDVAVYAFYKK